MIPDIQMGLELTPSPANRPIDGSSVNVQRRRDVDTRFRPGQSGNPSGKPSVRKFRRAILKQFNSEIAVDVKRGDVVADTTLTLAENGDMRAIEFVRDTLDGKPSNDTAGPVQVAIGIRLVGNDSE